MAQPAFADSQADCSIEGACCFPRSSPYGAARTVNMPGPRLATIAAITVGEGVLARPAVKRVLGGAIAALGACTSERGEVRAHIVIAPSGAAQVTRLVARSQVGHPADALAACATEALRATTFPATTGVTELDVRVTW